MSIDELLEIDKKERALLWETFLYEKMLDDNEEILLHDLNYYEERIREIGNTRIPFEISLLKLYMKHTKNIRSLLHSLKNDRHDTLNKQKEDLSANPGSEP